jgi:hypothetical protein
MDFDEIYNLIIIITWQISWTNSKFGFDEEDINNFMELFYFSNWYLISIWRHFDFLC